MCFLDAMTPTIPPVTVSTVVGEPQIFRHGAISRRRRRQPLDDAAYGEHTEQAPYPHLAGIPGGPSGTDTSPRDIRDRGSGRVSSRAHTSPGHRSCCYCLRVL